MSIRAALAVILALLAGICYADGNDIAVTPSTPVGGKSQGDWSQLWWQWAASFENDNSPVADRTGRFCDLRQNGPVWFLAGTYGTQRTIRTCKVPKDKHLFFPLINYVVFPQGGEKACVDCCAQYSAAARRITDAPSDLILELDGQRMHDLGAFRQVSAKCFDLGALTSPRYSVFPAAANGYYVMLKPLSPGKHELNFGGKLPGMSQAVTYTLVVE